MAWIERASDNFDRANENPLSGGGVWSTGQETNDQPTQIVSNVLKLTLSNQQNISYYSGYAFGADQYAQITVDLNNGSQGLVLRFGSNSGKDGYLTWVNLGPNICQLYKRISGSFTQIGSNGSAPDGGTRILRAEVLGTGFTIIYNGTTRITATDSSMAGPDYPGVEFYDMSIGATDNWSAGDWVDTTTFSKGRIVNEFGSGGMTRSSVVNSGGQ